METNQIIKEDIEQLKKAIKEKQEWLEWWKEKAQQAEVELRSFEDTLSRLEDELRQG